MGYTQALPFPKLQLPPSHSLFHSHLGSTLPTFIGVQAEMMVSAAMKVGFSGGLVIDFPHSTRAKKYFLCLMVRTTHGKGRGGGGSFLCLVVRTIGVNRDERPGTPMPP